MGQALQKTSDSRKLISDPEMELKSKRETARISRFSEDLEQSSNLSSFKASKINSKVGVL
jgi:hypothetical protein